MKKYRLGELIDVTRGKSLAGKFYATEGDLVRLTCGNFDYNNNCFKENTSKDNVYYTEKVEDKFILKKGDIITPLTEQALGLLGSTARIPESNKYIQSQDVALIKCKKGKLDDGFCYYLISSKTVKEQLSAAAQQTKIRHTSPDKIKDCTVFIPSLPEQERIAKVLSDIDSKIALNKKINRELEAMAKEIYDYWFVQFDFPNEEGKPYKSSGGKMQWNDVLKREIPAGWKVRSICSIAKIGSGGTPSKKNSEYWNGTLPFFGPTDYERDIFQFTTAEKITKEGLNNCSSKLYKAGDIFLTARGSIGKLVIVGTKMAMNQSCYALVPLFENTEYLFFLAKQLIQLLEMKGSGSVFKSIISSDIENSLLCIAPDSIILNFCDLTKPIFEKIKNNQCETLCLTKLRDELLPLLMNGQVVVE